LKTSRKELELCVVAHWIRTQVHVTSHATTDFGAVYIAVFV